jgi:SAM-dependent methyltransferase
VFFNRALDAALLIGGGVVEIGFEAAGDIDARIIEAAKEEAFDFSVVEADAQLTMELASHLDDLSGIAHGSNYIVVSESDRIIDLYERNAHNYIADRPGVNWDESAWLDRFIALLPRDATVLDIGCGSGEPIAGYFINRNFSFEGVDASATLVSVCRERYPKQRWHLADMRKLALGRTFQGLLAWDSLFHLSHDDQRRMFPRFKVHAASGAPLMFTSGTSHGVAIGSYHGEPLYHASLAAEEYRALLEANGFRVEARVTEDPRCGQHTIWLAQAAR